MRSTPRAILADTASALESRSAGAEPPEVLVVREHRVTCEGLGGALGHPRVFLEIGAAGFVECGYCDRRFVLSHAARRLCT